MKYIRTKDGRILVADNNSLMAKLTTNKVADTIEELCDEFVLFYMETKNQTPIPWATYERRGIWQKEREHIIQEIVNPQADREPVLFGAIWTDEGLIYIAKMNDKGELELL